MSTLNMPGFTADASVYKTSGHYWMRDSNVEFTAGVQAQLPVGGGLGAGTGQTAACAVACSMACIGACFWCPVCSTCHQCVNACMDHCTGGGLTRF
jgi:hypothetical protein